MAKKELLDLRYCKLVLTSVYAGPGVLLELETILAVHLFLVTTCMAQHDFLILS